MADGRIIVVYYNGLGHVTTTDQRDGGGAIACALSEDEGDTWSEPQTLLDTPMDDRDPSISLLRDGRLVLSYFRLVTVPKLAGDGVYVATVEQQRAVRTLDSRHPVKPTGGGAVPGRLAVQSIRKLQHDAGCSAPLRDFSDGLLMLGSYHLDQPYVIRSGDNGKTWQVFAIPNSGKHLDAETDIIEIVTSSGMSSTHGTMHPASPEGRAEKISGSERRTSARLQAGGRAENREASILVQLGNLGPSVETRPARLFYAALRGAKCNGHYSTSIDGKNWTVAADIGFPLHCPQLHRVAVFSKDPIASPSGALPSEKTGTAILLAHRIPATAMHYSLDECKTWQGPIKIDSCGGAYPCFVTLKDGSVLVVYYTEGTDSDIRCRRFTITKEGIAWP